MLCSFLGSATWLLTMPQVFFCTWATWLCSKSFYLVDVFLLCSWFVIVLRRLASSSFVLFHLCVDLLRVGDDFNLLLFVHWLFRHPHESASCYRLWLADYLLWDCWYCFSVVVVFYCLLLQVAILWLENLGLVLLVTKSVCSRCSSLVLKGCSMAKSMM